VDSADHIVVVARGSDLLAQAASTLLMKHGFQVSFLTPSTLGSISITLREELVFILGKRVDGILFRALPQSLFCQDFAIEDQSFSNTETRAAWLSALNLGSLLAVNRYDARAWFEGIGWSQWRSRLIEAGIPVSPFSIGTAHLASPHFWYPYMSNLSRPAPGNHSRRIFGAAVTPSRQTNVSLMVYGKIVSGAESSTVRACMGLLYNFGISIATVTTDLDDKVLEVDTQPIVSGQDLIQVVAQILCEGFRAHLYRR